MNSLRLGLFTAIGFLSSWSLAQDFKPADKPLEKVLEKTPEKSSEKVTDKASEKANEKAIDKAAKVESSKDNTNESSKSLNFKDNGRDSGKGERSKDNQAFDVKVEAINQKRQSILRLESEIGALQKSLSLANIEHEVFGAISYLNDTGSVKAASSASDTKIALSVLNFKAGYGYLLGDHLEPYLEVDQESVTKKVDSFTSTQNSTVFSAALLVNLPIAEDALAGKKMVYATWIPYIGFMFTSVSGSNESGADAKTTVSGNGMRSKLVAGVRYKLFERVALNSYLRFSFNQNSESAKGSGELGSSNSGQRIEVQLLGISIFI